MNKPPKPSKPSKPPQPKINLNEDDFYVLQRRGFIFTEELLGKGGFGKVYKGTHFDEEIAIKSMYMDPDESKPRRVLEKINEIFILKKLSRHESIVRLLGFYFVSSSHILIFMEFLNGKSLRDQLEAIEPDILCGQLAHNFFREIGSGLLYMHDSGFAHHDLKPPNILLKANKSQDNTNNLKISAKISDFGLSRARYNVQTGKACLVASSAGTMLYMAPEVLLFYVKNKKGSSTSTIPFYCPFLADVFALGLILYEMLHGNKKFPNQAEKKFPDINKVTGYQMMKTWFESKDDFTCDEKYQSYPELVQLMYMMVEFNPENRFTMDDVMENSWVTSPCNIKD